MLELPEVISMSKQINETMKSKRVAAVLPPTKLHKFCFFAGDPSEYDAKLKGAAIEEANGFGIFVDIVFDNGCKLSVNDGINMRLYKADNCPKDYQLMIMFDDGDVLCFTVAMYGCCYLHCGEWDNSYYLSSKAYVSPFSSEFADKFMQTYDGEKQSVSAKAFLATEQRFPGIGNGVVQDILFAAMLNPKTKVKLLSKSEVANLLSCTVNVLHDMEKSGGRDTEKNLFGEYGGYKTKMSKNTITSGCSKCGGSIVKEAYLGGSVYYCPRCQELRK